jgi:hypothetical protein
LDEIKHYALDLAEWLGRLTANAKVARVLVSVVYPDTDPVGFGIMLPVAEPDPGPAYPDPYTFQNYTFFPENFIVLSKILKIMTSIPLSRNTEQCRLELL